MKTVGKFLTVLCIAVLVSSCSSDDDGTTGDTSADLVGTWIMQSFEYEGETSTSFEGTEIDADFDGTAINIDTVLEFTESPNEFVSSGSYDIELTSTIMGETQSFTESIDNFSSEGTWERDGNTLITDGAFVELDGSTDILGDMGMNMSEATILELTDTTLRLGQEDSQEVTQDGITVSFSFTSEIVFTRQ